MRHIMWYNILVCAAPFREILKLEEPFCSRKDVVFMEKKPIVKVLRSVSGNFIETVGLAEPEGESLSKPTEPDANQNDPIFQVSSVASANDCTGIAVTVPNDDFEANSVAHLAPVNVTSKESGK